MAIIANAAFFYALVVIATYGGLPTASAAVPSSTSSHTDVTKTALLIHQKINEERTSRGLKALPWDADLAKIASGHSKDMAIRNYFSHNDLEGHIYTYRYSVAGYVCQRSSGENIYWYGTTGSITEESLARKAVNAWMNSSGHRQNILNSSFQLEGIGVAFDSSSNYKNSFYITQDFCARRG